MVQKDLAENSRNEKVGFTLHLIQITMKFYGILLCATQVGNHPFVQHMHAEHAIRLFVT